MYKGTHYGVYPTLSNLCDIGRETALPALRVAAVESLAIPDAG